MTVHHLGAAAVMAEVRILTHCGKLEVSALLKTIEENKSGKRRFADIA